MIRIYLEHNPSEEKSLMQFLAICFGIWMDMIFPPGNVFEPNGSVMLVKRKTIWFIFYSK